MVVMDFHDSIAYPLYKEEKLILRGYFNYDNEVFFHSKADFSREINDFFIPKNIEKFKYVNGNYFIVSECETAILILVDRINSFPVYYYTDGHDLIVTDRLPQGKVVDTEKIEEFLACGFVIQTNTVYKDVYQLQAGQMIVIDKKTGSYYCQNYFKHIHNPVFGKSDKEWISDLSVAINKTMDNMVNRLNGRHVALFLSGGYDSKLIASELRRRNYNNVTCIILGSEETRDVTVAKKIADTLNYKYIHIVVDKKYWEKKLETGYMNEYFKKSASYSSMPYLQGIVLKDLLEDGRISTDSVAVTGNSGDVVEGNDVTHKFYTGREYTLSDVKSWIVDRHFMLNGKASAKNVAYCFNMEKYLNVEEIKTKNAVINAEEAEDIIEYFNWRERQSKYVVQDVRNYDYVIGSIEWLLPLWDNVFIDFWLTVPYELRYDRKLYYMYLGKEILPSANKKTAFRRIIDSIKKVSGDLLLPIYSIKAMYDYKHNNDFYFATYGLVKKKRFKELLKTTRGYREPHSENIARMTAQYF